VTTGATHREEPQFVIEEEDDDDAPASANADSTAGKKNSSGDAAKPTLLPCLAEELISYSVDLLFCCGFTIPTSVQVEHHKINYLIWYRSSSMSFDANGVY
jgi:hypothetical protein